MFRETHPLAWTYHCNTIRYPFNVHGVSVSSSEEAPFKEYLDLPLIPLPESELPSTPLKDVLLSRLSCRNYLEKPITRLQLAMLLKAAYGINKRIYLGEQEFLERCVPSGGGLYPLELYLLVRNVEETTSGVYHYVSHQHALEQIRALEIPDQFLSDLFLGQPYIVPAATIIVITAVLERSLWKYEDRGYRYILFEAGHVAQNLNLTAVASGLGSLNLGGFFDAELAGLLDVDLDREIPLYCTAVGNAGSGDRVELRITGEAQAYGEPN